MAYPLNSLTTSGSGTGSGSAFTIPSLLSGYADDDVICVLLTNDGAGATLDLSAGSKTAGWATAAGTSGATPAGEANCVLAYIKASGVVSAPSFVCSNTAVLYSVFVLRDVDTTTAIDVASSNASGTKDWTAANSATAPSVTANYSDSLAIYIWCVDTAQYLRTKLDDAVCIAKYAPSNDGHIVAYRQLNSTTVPTPTMYTNGASNGGNRWTIVFKNKSGGALAPQLRGTMVENDSGKLPNWYGDFGAQHNAVTWQAPSNFAATINGVTVSSNAPTVTSGTLNAVPWGAASNIANGTNANEITGGTHTITSADYSGKTVAFTWAINGQNSTGYRINTDGAMFGLSDGTNWSVWQLASKAKGWISADANCAVIDLSTATPIYTSGTLDLTAVTRVAYLWHRASGSATADAFMVMNLAVIDQEVMTGGGSSRPLKLSDYWFMAQSWSHFRLVPLQGSGQVLCKYSVQIGDGTSATYFDSAAESFETPQAYSLTSALNWQQDWNVGASGITLNIKASTSDTINLASGVAATATSQAFTIDAASGVPSVYSFAQSFVGWTATDSKGLSWVGSTFKNGGTVTIAGGGDMTNCSITDTTSTNAALAITANGSTLDGTTIDVTGTSAAYHLELGTAVTAVTLTDTTFTGTPGTDKVHVLKTTGTVTITISGTTSLVAGDVTSAGATVVISAPVTYQSVTISNVVSGSRVQIYDTTNSVELCNGTASNSASGTGKATGATVVSGSPATFVWTDNVAALTSGSRAIRVRISYVSGATADTFIEAAIGTCDASGSGVAIAYRANQVADTTYNSNAVDGSAVTGITFTDAATDLVVCNIGAGTVAWKTIYAAFVYWNFTATGIANDFTYVDAPDTANYLLSGMKIRNTSVVDLSVTGGYGRDATSGLSSDIIDTAGSTGNIFLAPDHVVPYATSGTYAITGDISTVLTAVSNVPTAVLSAATSAPIAADVKKMNAATVTGTGQEGDLWRGA